MEFMERHPFPASAHICSSPGMVRCGSGTEIPCIFGTSGSMRIADFDLRSQVCYLQTLPALVVAVIFDEGLIGLSGESRLEREHRFPVPPYVDNGPHSRIGLVEPPAVGQSVVGHFRLASVCLTFYMKRGRRR